MKIRTITVGVVLKPEDFLCGSESPSSVFNTLLRTSEHLNAIEQALSIATSHEVQTLRVHTNSFEDWLLPLFQSPHNMTLSDAVGILERALNAAKISMCSIGPCESSEGIELAPHILALCDKLSCSVLFRKESNDDICPSYNKCLLAARSCLKLHQQCGDLGNFRFCASFHCPEGIPFFPAAYRIQRGSFSDTQPLLTIGLENGDLLFLAFHGTQSTYNTGSLNGTTEMDNIGSRRNPHAQGRDNLRDMMQQICLPIQEVVVKVCEERGVIYGGIDASINPGLALPDSIGAGLESLMPASATVVPGREKDKEKEALRCFGAMGSLAAVSTVTSAVKSLANGDNMNTTGTSTLAEGRDTVNAATATATGGNSVYANNSYAPSIDGRLNLDPYVSVNKSIKLAGYSGLMLPVMEDVVLAQRAAEGRFSFRDLLTFSAVCGVGLDTVPVPGDTSEEVLAGVYMETATMAFRLNKPLSCRVLPQQGKVAGDVTDVASPYLCNTTVFSIP